MEQMDSIAEHLALTQLYPVLVSCPEIYSLISSLAMNAFTWDKWIYKQHFCEIIFSKLSGKHFIDHTLQMYRLIPPHYLCILPRFSNSGDTQISVYIHVPLGHAVFQKAFWDKQCNF